MKFIFIITCLFAFCFCISAQTAEQEVLATAKGYKFTAKDLPADIETAYNSLPAKLAETRQNLLDEQISEVLIEAEAAARKLPVEKLLETEVAGKVPDPTDEQIKNIFEINRASIGNQTFEEIRPQIVAFLRREPQQKAYLAFLSRLKAKYKVSPGKDVKAANLKNFEVLATVGSKQITAADFDARNRFKLSDFEYNFYDQIRDALEQVVFSALVLAEAKSLDMEPADLLAREITNKLRDFSDEERQNLQNIFQAGLFQKYQVKFLLKEPATIKQNISTDDDPSQGRPDAPVTVVMFSDFQCPTCAAVHPILKKVLAEYGTKTRFVVRDFPLTAIHKNAFRAALAANAANAQGKFFEYTDVLYQNQDKLDDLSLKKFAADLGLNISQFDLDLNNEKFAEEIRKDLADGINYGVSGTPTIFVNGVKVRKLSADSFRKAIEQDLNK